MDQYFVTTPLISAEHELAVKRIQNSLCESHESFLLVLSPLYAAKTIGNLASAVHLCRLAL